MSVWFAMQMNPLCFSVCVCMYVHAQMLNKISKVLFTASQLHKYPSGNVPNRKPFFSFNCAGNKQTKIDKRQQGPCWPCEQLWVLLRRRHSDELWCLCPDLTKNASSVCLFHYSRVQMVLSAEQRGCLFSLCRNDKSMHLNETAKCMKTKLRE